MNFIELLEKNPAPETLSALSLAYLGDAVYELYVRTRALDYTHKAHKLNKLGIQSVNHLAQAELLARLESELKEEELLIVRRGKNAKGIVPKNAKVINYRKATALEALVGYLYLKGEHKRLLWVLGEILTFKEDADEPGR